MNFLAHHIVSIYPGNYYYNLGLTFPDILALQNNKCKVTENLVDQKLKEFKEDILLNNNKENLDITDLFLGMKIHLLLDKWFHNSKSFFYLMKKTSEIVEKNYFPIHQFIEILFDIYIDTIDKNYAKSLINTYKDDKLDLVLPKIKSFFEVDQVVFNKLRSYISTATFYKTYLNDDNLLELLKRLSMKINRKNIYLEDTYSKKLINVAKEHLKDDFELLYNELIGYSNKIQQDEMERQIIKN
ncbi:MAG: hypothetical protein GYA61_04380 [Spirochaetales bacterium]|nr:hypothetical protein [Spirochaetales bacterium]